MLVSYGLYTFNRSKWDDWFVLWNPTVNENYEIVGVMQVDTSIDWPTVYAVAANDGYGPAVYRAAMSILGSLAPFQDESYVSPEASRVWEYFYNEGLETQDILDSPHYYDWLRKIYFPLDDLDEYEMIGLYSDDDKDMVENLATMYLDNIMRKVYNAKLS